MPSSVNDVDATRFAEIRDIAADIFTVEPEEVEAAESFVDDLGIDSLTAIDLLAQLEKRYGVTIDGDELANMVNLRSSYAVVARIAGW